MSIKDDGLKDFIQELRDYGNARPGELAGMILEAANRLEFMSMKLRMAGQGAWITDRDTTPEEVEEAGDSGFILCISGSVGKMGYIYATDMQDNFYEDGRWYLHGAYPSKITIDGEEIEKYTVHGWMMPPSWEEG